MTTKTKDKTTTRVEPAINKGAVATLVSPQQVAKWKQPTPQRDYLLLDSSDSMESKWSDALHAVNGYVRSLGSRVNTKLMLATFANEYNVIRDNQPPMMWKNITSEEVEPDGATALNDAIGRIVATAKRDNPDKAAIVIATDGGENASKEVTDEQAKALLDECRERGWQVIHLHIGSAATAQAMSDVYGIGANQTVALDKQSLTLVLQKTAEKRTEYAKSGTGMTFTDSERKTLLLR
jgi:uncharacterized protein with von Willebrand factor type A (vWA) domain